MGIVLSGFSERKAKTSSRSTMTVRDRACLLRTRLSMYLRHQRAKRPRRRMELECRHQRSWQPKYSGGRQNSDCVVGGLGNIGRNTGVECQSFLVVIFTFPLPVRDEQCHPPRSACRHRPHIQYPSGASPALHWCTANAVRSSTSPSLSPPSQIHIVQNPVDPRYHSIIVAFPFPAGAGAAVCVPRHARAPGWEGQCPT